ncbi:Translation factor pelota [Rhizina undulata]
MRLIKKYIERDKSGSITLCPEEPEDMWHAYNLIRPNDRLKASAMRRVTTQTATGSTASQRVLTTLTVLVTKIDFDAAAGQLHISGRVCVENKFVNVGVHHTLDLELHRNFTIYKEEWDSVALGVVNDACDAMERAEIGAVVLHEGLANICLITEHMTILRQRIDMTIPRKRKGSAAAYEKGLEKFFSTIYASLPRHFNFTNLKVILIASPGFLAESLHTYLFATALQTNDRPLLLAKPKFITTHCSTGHIHALNEVLKSPAVAAKLADTKFARETKAMEKFFEMMNLDEFRAWYGPKEVQRAVEQGAVGTLLISNSLFRSDNIALRKQYVRMVEDVKKNGGEAMVLSSIHESGVRLDGLGGIAAILNFPLTDLDEEPEPAEEEEEEEVEEKVGGAEQEKDAALAAK